MAKLDRYQLFPFALATIALTLALTTAVAGPAAAAEVPGEARYSDDTSRRAPTRIAEEREIEPLVELDAAAVVAPEALEELGRHNRAQRGRAAPRLRDGFSRSFEPRELRLGPGRREQAASLARQVVTRRGEATLTWSAKVVVAGAYALRIGLSELSLPRQSRLWVYAPDRPALGPFGPELMGADGILWLPPMDGPTVYLEIELPSAAAERGEVGFVIDRILELVDPNEVEPQVWTDCDIDGTCVGTGTMAEIEDYRAGVARLSFIDGSFSYLCSGGLVNDTDTSGFREFLLTANHCFASQAAASSLVAYFDYRTPSCGGAAPSLGSVPQVSGATLLASSPQSDFTLVELSGDPGGFRFYLGWTTATPAGGQTLYRLAHPSGQTQRFSTQSFLASGGIVCSGLDRPDFHYSSGLSGSTAGGSSGAPVVDAELHIVGQLLGVCHLPSSDDCSYATFNYVDGAFATTFPQVSGWLAPAVTCTDDAFEEDDTCFGSFIQVGESQVHSHCDEDWIWFEAIAGATYRIETSSLGGGADTTLALHSECGSELVFDDDGGDGLGSRIDFVAASTTPIDVRIREFGGLYESGLTYTVSVSCLSGCTDDGIFADGFESGDTSAWSATVP